MLIINVPNMNDSFVSIELGGKQFLMRFTYNEKYDYWNFGLYTDEQKAIISMTKIVPRFPLFAYYTNSDMPDGLFACMADTSLERVGQNAFANYEAEFYYIPYDEILADDDIYKYISGR